MLMVTPAMAGYSDEKLRSEILEGLDIVTIRINEDFPEPAPGELGYSVYETADAGRNENIKLFIPSTMYLRAGGGLNLPFATDKAKAGNKNYSSAGSWSTQIGLGWNLSSYVRTEIDFQESTFTFSDTDAQAFYQTIGGTLYFDFLRRYVQTGDITYRRHFVPFMGIGVAVGNYEFEGGGSDGLVIAAPRATLGFNVRLTDLIGIDIMYQYQMMIGNGFGWDGAESTINNISNIMASFRVNF